MTNVRIELSGDEATCFESFRCFARLFEDPLAIPVGHPVHLHSNGGNLGDAVVVAIQEVWMRAEGENIVHGFLFIFSSDMEIQTVNFESTLIIKPEMAKCYQEYGYVALPFATEDDLTIGGVMEFTNAGLGLELGVIVAAQKFMPSWHYLFIVARPPE